MTRRLRSWLATADPNLAAQGGMLPGIFRDFHRYVHRDGKTFGVDVSSYKIPVRLKIRTEHGKRRRREIEIEHPIILLSHWMASLLVTFPKFFLAGICPERDGPDAYMDIFSRFWERFEWSQPDHPVYQKKLRRSVAALSRLQFMGMKDEDWLKFHYW